MNPIAPPTDDDPHTTRYLEIAMLGAEVLVYPVIAALVIALAMVLTVLSLPAFVVGLCRLAVVRSVSLLSPIVPRVVPPAVVRFFWLGFEMNMRVMASMWGLSRGAADRQATLSEY